MNNSFPFDVDDDFWADVIDRLEQETEYDRGEIERGLTFMLGRRAGELLQSFRDNGSEELFRELEIAIVHSREDK